MSARRSSSGLRRKDLHERARTAVQLPRRSLSAAMVPHPDSRVSSARVRRGCRRVDGSARRAIFRAVSRRPNLRKASSSIRSHSAESSPDGCRALCSATLASESIGARSNAALASSSSASSEVRLESTLSPRGRSTNAALHVRLALRIQLPTKADLVGSCPTRTGPFNA